MHQMKQLTELIMGTDGIEAPVAEAAGASGSRDFVPARGPVDLRPVHLRQGGRKRKATAAQLTAGLDGSDEDYSYNNMGPCSDEKLTRWVTWEIARSWNLLGRQFVPLQPVIQKSASALGVSQERVTEVMQGACRGENNQPRYVVAEYDGTLCVALSKHLPAAVLSGTLAAPEAEALALEDEDP